MRESWRKTLVKWWGRFGRYQPVCLVLAVGVLLLLLPTGTGTEENGGPAAISFQESFHLEEFEERLAKALSQIQGAGETRVVLTLKGGSRQVLAQDTKRGADGDSSASTVTLGRGSGGQEVIPLQTLAPQFQGALVVCPGGGDPAVCLRLVDAVSALTGLGADKISICKSK